MMIIQISSFLCLLLLSSGFNLVEKSLKRERRQIFYEDIMNKPKTFRSRADEKERIPNVAESELSQDVKPSLDPDFLANLLANSDNIYNTPPKGSPIKDSNPFKGIIKPNPSYEDYYDEKPKPKPFYEEPLPLKPTYGKPIRQKPKPAYEEPYILKPFAQEELFQKPSNYENSGLDNRFAFEQNYPSGGPSRKPKPFKKQITNSIPGIAEKDYPIYNEVPITSFACDKVPFKPGMYANPETGCQAYHVCHDNRHGPQGASFLCTNGTLFNQETFNCDWWFNVDCSKAESLYSLNSDPDSNPYYRKPFEEIQYKSENLAETYNPKLSSNLLLESKFSPTFSNVPKPESPKFPNFNFFSFENAQPNPGSFSTPKRVRAPVSPPLSDKVKATPKVERTASFTAPKIIKASQNPLLFEAERRTTISERRVPPSDSKQSFRMEEKVEKSQEFVRKFEDRSESINVHKNKKLSVAPPPQTSNRRILRRRKRPRPSGTVSNTASESLDQPSAKHNINNHNSEISKHEVPEDAILDFEWGQRTS